MIRFESGTALFLQLDVLSAALNVFRLYHSPCSHKVRRNSRPFALKTHLVGVIHSHQHLANAIRQIEGIDQGRIMRIDVRRCPIEYGR